MAHLVSKLARAMRFTLIFSLCFLLFPTHHAQGNAPVFPLSPTEYFPATNGFAGKMMDTSLQRPPMVADPQKLKTAYGIEVDPHHSLALRYVSSGTAHEYYLAIIPLVAGRPDVKQVDILHEHFLSTPLPPPLRSLFHMSAIYTMNQESEILFFPMNPHGPLVPYRSRYLVTSMNGVRPYSTTPDGRSPFKLYDALFRYMASYNLYTLEAILTNSRERDRIGDFVRQARSETSARLAKWKAIEQIPSLWQPTVLSAEHAAVALGHFIDHGVENQTQGEGYCLLGHTCVDAILNSVSVSGHLDSQAAKAHGASYPRGWDVCKAIPFLGRFIPALSPQLLHARGIAASSKLYPFENFPGYSQALNNVIEHHHENRAYGRTNGPISSQAAD